MSAGLFTHANVAELSECLAPIEIKTQQFDSIASVPPAGGRVHPEGGRAAGNRLKILHDRGGHSRVLQNNPGAQSTLLQPIADSPCNNHCVACIGHPCHYANLHDYA